MTNVDKRVRLARLLLAGIPIVAWGCKGIDSLWETQNDSDTGVAEVALTAVPSDVQCVVIVAAGTRTVQQSFDVAPGQPALLSLSGLPSGAVTFSGQAFSGACASVTGSSVPAYVADPVTVQVSPPTVASVSLFMHRNGQASVGIDFEGADGGFGGTGGAAGAAGGGGRGGAAGTSAGGAAGTSAGGAAGTSAGGAAGTSAGGAAGGPPPTIQPSMSALTVPEGTSASITVRLSADPGGSVAVSISSSNTTKVTAGPATLTFSSANFATPQTVTVTSLQDTDIVTDTVPLTLSAPGLASVGVTVTDTDDDVQAIQLNMAGPITMSETTSAGPAVTTTVGVRLAFAPAGSVTVTVASSNTAKLTTTPTSLTFTPANFATSQIVTLTSVHDTDATNDTVTVTCSGGGAPTAVGLTVNITDTGT
jgi:hypothetical protein